VCGTGDESKAHQSWSGDLYFSFIYIYFRAEKVFDYVGMLCLGGIGFFGCQFPDKLADNP
jgi:hypothetical protein